jgi:hypothetical protein
MAELQKRGLLVALVCSTPFANLGRIQSGQLGAPGLPLLVIPHPLGGIGLEQVRQRAAVLTAKVIEFMKGGMP